MKHLALALALFGAATLAQADVTVSDPWVRGTVPAQRATGAFMRLQADQDLRLVAASSPVAGVAEIHEMVMQDNVMKMRRVDGIALGKGKPLELKPGGYHVMLMDLKQPLKAGEQVPLTLTFEGAAKGKTITKQVQATVQSLAPQGSQGHGAMMKH
ncbi:MAG: copper chaperone PCu(A)C [Brachymonas denitrificans]|uniref:copper chaperone PCu(A)C n=1 Tax=Brachymonas denitrificans TaxID=28220 RepID=UPI001BCF2B71|nr:copper chaperone PCu(A)C [Brachymonas denitrificans]